ncbi:MAG: DUF5711 family protein [Clostridia bacterium]|jgi:hypothetical protein
MYPYSYQRQQLPRTGRKYFFLFIVLLFILCLSGVLLYRYIHFEQQKKVLEHTVPIPIPPKDPWIPYGDGFVHARNDSVVFLNHEGEKAGEVQTKVKDGKLAVSRQYSVHYNDQSFAVLTWNKLLYRKQIDSGTILGVQAGTRPVAVLIKDEKSSDLSLTVYDRKGNPIDEIVYREVTMVDFGFHEKDDQLWTITLDTNGIAPSSQLATYKPGISMTGVITVNDQIIYQVIFTPERIIAVGTNSILCYNYSGECTYEKSIYGWVLQDIRPVEGDSVLMLLSPSSGKASPNKAEKVSTLRLLDLENVDKILPLPGDAVKIIAREKDFISIQERAIHLMAYDGKTKKEIRLPFVINQAFPIVDKKGLLLIQDTKIYYLPL